MKPANMDKTTTPQQQTPPQPILSEEHASEATSKPLREPGKKTPEQWERLRRSHADAYLPLPAGRDDPFDPSYVPLKMRQENK